MLVVDVLDINPLNQEKTFEFQRVVFPPKGEGFFVISRSESCYSFEHTRFDHAEKQIHFCLVFEVLLPKLL